MSEFVGQTLGDYRIEALLGSGRTGQVFQAAHVRLDTLVALKIIDPKLTAAPDFKARFFEYAQALGGLVHPHVVRVRESGEDDRRWFVAMDLVTGGSLEKHRHTGSSKEWKPSMWLSVELVRQAAEGVAAAHDAGIVHGDITMADLLLSDTSGAAQVRVSDFGLRILAPADGSGGTPTDLETHRQRDLFALGEVLYELTTGRPPFPRKGAVTEIAESGSGVTSPRRVLSGFPDTVELIIVKCLASDPRDRFSTARELAKALGDAVAASGSAGGQSMVVKGPAGLAPVGSAMHTTAVPVARPTPPPVPQPTIVPGGQAVPCVHVLDGSGNRVDLEYVRHTGLRIGRSSENDIVLPSAGVSVLHARIDWNHDLVTVTDLGSTNNTLLRGRNLLPQVTQEWESGQWLQVGPYWLWLEEPKEYTGRQNRIEVVVDQRAKVMTIVPGKPATCRVTLANQKTTIEHVELAVTGIPGEWVEGTNVKRYLPALERRDVDLVINVPKTPDGRAGAYTVTISAHSVTDPESEAGSATASWTVEPFDASKVLITPSKASGRRSAKYTVALHNDGNHQSTYVVTGSDDDKQLDYVLSAEGHSSGNRLPIEVSAGTKTNLKLEVIAPRRWFGNASQHPFVVQTAAAEGRPGLTAEAHFSHKAVFPVWMLAAVPLLLVGFVMLIPWLVRPVVRTVYVDPITPVAGETFSIFWDAPRATRIRVLVNELPVRPDPNPDEGTYVFAGGFEKDTRVKVVGSNLFGEVSREVTVALKPRPPAKPPILEMTVVPLVVAPGNPVTIQWSATNATRAEFSHRGSVSLSDEYTDHPTETQTYVVTAYNAEGIEVKKSFQVRVQRGPVRAGFVRLEASSPSRKKNVPGFQLNQGQFVFFDWEAPNATKVRLEAVTPLELAGTSGRGRRAQLRARGHYTFRLVATSETGDEVFSQPIEIDVACTRIQIATKRCNSAPEVRW